MNITDMTIHIPQDLHPHSQERLEGELRQLEGVSAVRFNSRINHWISVLYDPESITAMKILKQLRRWDKDAVFVF